MRTTRFGKLLGAALAGILTATSVAVTEAGDGCHDAGGCHDVHGGGHDIRDGYERNVAWPEPYFSADSASVCAPFAVMVQKGWQEENMVGSHLFKQGRSELTDAGKSKVRWILTEAPPQYHTIYVERGNTPQETAARMAVTRSIAEQMAIGSESVSVQESNLVSYGWPAEEIDKVLVKFQTTAPDPRLPAGSSGFDTGGGGSGGSK